MAIFYQKLVIFSSKHLVTLFSMALTIEIVITNRLNNSWLANYDFYAPYLRQKLAMSQSDFFPLLSLGTSPLGWDKLNIKEVSFERDASSWKQFVEIKATTGGLRFPDKKRQAFRNLVQVPKAWSVVKRASFLVHVPQVRPFI